MSAEEAELSAVVLSALLVVIIYHNGNGDDGKPMDIYMISFYIWVCHKCPLISYLALECEEGGIRDGNEGRGQLRDRDDSNNGDRPTDRTPSFCNITAHMLTSEE
jgi:hypothetical protein